MSNNTSTKEYIISGCTVADSDALAANNLPAFWADPHFRLNWPDRTLEYHVIQVAKRFPNNLLTGRETKRHLKAVDPDTNRIVGYVRWILPDGFDASVWPEAVTPAVSEDDEAFFRRLASMADWATGDTTDEPISPVQMAENEILSKKAYIQLDYLAVHPDNQGRGIATQLVASGLEEAEKIGLDVYVRAFRPGVGLYRRLGFRIEKELVLDDSEEGGPGEVYRALMTYATGSAGIRKSGEKALRTYATGSTGNSEAAENEIPTINPPVVKVGLTDRYWDPNQGPFAKEPAVMPSGRLF